MNFFTISDIENLTGIKAHTFRVWEQRYGICTPKGKESSHRYYDSEDLKTILRVAFLYHKGHRISTIAGLSTVELERFALENGDGRSSNEHFLNRLIEASIDINQPDFESAINEVIKLIGFEATITEIIFPFLRKIGLFWLTGHVIPAMEHFASNIIVQKIIAETGRLPGVERKEASRTILLFCPEKEYHEIPLLIMHYLLKKSGVYTVYLGANVSLDTIIAFCSKQQVDELFFHLITNLGRYPSQTYIDKLVEIFPDKKISCSGLGVENLTENSPAVKILTGAGDLVNYVRKGT